MQGRRETNVWEHGYVVGDLVSDYHVLAVGLGVQIKPPGGKYHQQYHILAVLDGSGSTYLHSCDDQVIVAFGHRPLR